MDCDRCKKNIAWDALLVFWIVILLGAGILCTIYNASTIYYPERNCSDIVVNANRGLKRYPRYHICIDNTNSTYDLCSPDIECVCDVLHCVKLEHGYVNPGLYFGVILIFVGLVALVAYFKLRCEAQCKDKKTVIVA